MKKTILRIALGAGCALALIGVASANHSWSNYHWARTANPFNLQVIDSVTSFWQSEFNTALGEWSQSNVLDLAVTSADDSNRVRRQCRLPAGKIRVCNQAYGNNGWLGLATIGIDSQGHIDRGSAKMNDTYASYWTIPGEKRHVMCQEIGHLFGLDHTSEDGSSQSTCMDYSQSLNSQSPNSHDYQQLSAIYAHVDTYNSYLASGAAVAAQAGPDLPEGVPSGALMVRQNRFERVYVRGRPDGGYYVFHVRLAPANAR